jgi:two-component system, NtrC family, sensor kinase
MQSELSTVGADQSIEELRRELAEACRREVAIADILRVISRSPTDLQSVLDAVAKSAARLCEAETASVFRCDGDQLRLAANHRPLGPGIVGGYTIPLIRGTANGRAVLEGLTIHIADLQSEAREYPEGSETARKHGHRTVLAVPLLREGIVIGSISLRRASARLFTDAQVALAETFAGQAVIAIENTRLFVAEQASKRELQTSLEYQTATSEVLNVISRSPTDAQPAFDAIAEGARKLCDGFRSAVYRFDGTLIHHIAHNNWTTDGLEVLHRVYPRPLSRETQIAQAILDGAITPVCSCLTWCAARHSSRVVFQVLTGSLNLGTAFKGRFTHERSQVGCLQPASSI